MLCSSRIGKEMEGRLFAELDKLNLAYMSETELFKLGYPKTPDALLSLPIAIESLEEGGQPIIINWIESKAFFGNRALHESNLQKQYWAYHNR
jgi:CDAN1-interacting nuclease 1